ncbi:hypothetical protein GCM10027036_34140 [Flavihumibacter cheonanensis]
MSKEEIKSEINKILDTLPDTVLEDLLSLLSSISDSPSRTFDAIALLSKILEEDNNLLKRLAIPE